MVIVISVNNSFRSITSDYSYFLERIIAEWTKQYPQHQFHLFIDENFLPINQPEKNLFIFPYKPSGKFFYRWQLKKKLTGFVKKTKAQLIVSINEAILSNRQLHQCLIALDKEVLRSTNKKKTEVLESIIVLSEASRQMLIAKNVPREKITVVYGAAKETEVVSEDEKLALKEKFTEGEEYFIYKGITAPDKNIVQLLKAFSLFKKRQKSSMKLVITGKVQWNKEEFNKLISTYKYRNDLVIMDQLSEEEQLKMLGTAYAFVYPSTEDIGVMFAFDAMKYKVPVIATECLPLKEIAGNSALYCNASDVSDIAEKMMLIYKDESLRSRLINDAKAIVDRYTWPQAAAIIWQTMEARSN